MFVVLGLLSTPSHLVDVAVPALLISAVLILVARPLAVVPLLLPFRFSVREHALVSWVGLKGAVPIILATFPMMANLPEGRLLFNVVFFVVLISATLQGWTLPLFASRLGLQDKEQPPASVSLELLSLHDVNAEIVEYAVASASGIAGRAVSDLSLPSGALIALVSRGKNLVAPQGATRIEAGDHLFVIAPASARGAVDAVFSDPSRRS
jgi:cell volume regulation protein A